MADITAALPDDLAALVGSRLCHDLISPLGAIGNGVELLAMSGSGVGPELQLITESVGNATARLKFFRVAFGMAGSGQRLGQLEIAALLDDFGRGGRQRYAWQVDGDQARHEVKLAFLALLCLEAALPWGGVVSIRKIAEHWHLSADAGRTKPDPDLWARLDGSAGPVTPAQVQFALLPLEVARLGRAVSWSVTETGAGIGF